MKSDKKGAMLEFLRYAIVGGISALCDMGVNYVMLYYVFKSDKNNTPLVVLSVALGFIVGLIINFVLSNIFVFVKEEQKKQGKTVKAFLIYTLVGIIGLGLTELLTLLGTLIIGEQGIFYIILSCFVKGVVLVWNYIGRKIFVYKSK